jgi:predicted anti-sigma-YlaC factor YlaD
MDCQHIQGNLMAYLEGGLDRTITREIEQHLASCSTCRGFADLLQETFQMIDAEKNVQFDPYQISHIQAALANRGRVRQRVFTPVRIQTIIIAVVICILVYAGFNTGSTFFYQSSLKNDYETEVYYLNDMNGDSFETLLTSE